MPALKVDPEWQENFALLSSATIPKFTDALELRKCIESGIHARFHDMPRLEGFKETKHEITSVDGTKINVYRLVPPSAPTDSITQRAIVYVFGGGMISGRVDLYYPLIESLADTSCTQVFAVDYRLGIDRPFPAAVEDVYSAIVWLQANARTFDVDPARIAVCGLSAGGGVAAGVLMSPMLDDRTTIPEDHPLTPHLTWTTEFSDLGWKTYLGGKEKVDRTDANVSIYAAPARAKDVSGLPATFINVGSLDLFRDEDIAYAARLAAANVDVEFHLYLGFPHGLEIAGQDTRQAGVMRDNRDRFLSRI
ncbi:Alpha/Beta hydrolase protein [Biscogniauxia marginata]|nr:Alpha/Beta hydrolase protein [Biscogniauxia marginata]